MISQDEASKEQEMPDNSILSMRNLGPVMAAQLADIGILTRADLQAVGAVEAFHRLRIFQGRHINRTALHAMFAALADCDWRALPSEIKAKLDREAGLDTRRRR
jgi:hypothetical protein